MSIFQRDVEDQGERWQFDSSVKNFTLIFRNGGNQKVLVFGRVEENSFHVYFKRPLSFVQAFGLCIAACEAKYY